MHKNIKYSVAKASKSAEDELDVINLLTPRENDSDYIREVPEELEVTTRFTRSVR